MSLVKRGERGLDCVFPYGGIILSSTIFLLLSFVLRPCNQIRYAQKKADEMKAISLQSALDTVESLEIKLTDFAKKHQSEIQNDPVFRQRYVGR